MTSFKNQTSRVRAKSPLILVTGATGTMGTELVKKLVEARHRVRALVRDLNKARKLGGSAEIVRADLAEPETLDAAFADVDNVFLLSKGPEIATLEGNALNAAKKAGVKRIVKFDGRHIDADFMADAPVAKWHLEVEKRLRELGVDWTILRATTFASNFMFWLDKKQGAFFLPVGDGKDTPIDPRDIAEVAVKLLTAPEHVGRIYEITGPETLSFSEMAQVISTIVGKPVKFIDVPPIAAREGMIGTGFPPSLADSMLAYFSGIREGKIRPPTSTFEELLGRPPPSFNDWVRDHADALEA